MFNWINNLIFYYGFLEIGSNYTESLVNFFNLISVLLISITFLIGYWMNYILKNHNFKKEILINIFNWNFLLRGKNKLRFFLNTNLNDRTFSYIAVMDIKDYSNLETTWCLAPLFFVSGVSYPSIGLEYGISPDITPLVSLKVIANQWYWVFELEAKMDFNLIEGDNEFFLFNSDLYKLFLETYGDADLFFEKMEGMDYQVLSKVIEVNLNPVNTADSAANFYRLLGVDNKLILPVNTPIKLIVTSNDVLHSFSINALGLKIDAIPGRLSEQLFLIEKPGIYWGMCSELCGPYHGFMPVIIEATSYPIFLKSFF
jgi:heme/copper-type cytochrome/quinol oxidase subunit 2